MIKYNLKFKKFIPFVASAALAGLFINNQTVSASSVDESEIMNSKKNNNYEEIISQKKGEKQKLTEQISLNDEKIAHLNGQKVQLNNQLEESKNALRNNNDQIAILNKNEAAIEKQVAELQTELDTQRKEFNEKNTQLAAFNEQRQQADAKVNELKNSLIQEQNNLSNKERELKNLETERKTLTDKIKNSENSDNSKKLTKMIAEKDDLTRRRQFYERNLPEATQDYNETMAFIKESQAKLDKLNQNPEENKDEIAKLKKKIADRKASDDHIILVYGNVSKLYNKFTKEIADLTAKIEAFQATFPDVDGLKEQEKELSANIESLKQEIATVQNKIEEDQKTIEATNNQISEIDAKISKAKSSLDALETAINNSQAQFDESKDKLNKSKTELVALKQKAEDFQHNNENYVKQIAQIDIQIAEIKQSKTELMQKAEQLNDLIVQYEKLIEEDKIDDSSKIEMSDASTQTDEIDSKEEGTATDDLTSEDGSTQTEDPEMVDKGINTDTKTNSDGSSQTEDEKPSTSDEGIGTDTSTVDDGVQTDETTGTIDEGTNTDIFHDTDSSTQTEDFDKTESVTEETQTDFESNESEMVEQGTQTENEVTVDVPKIDYSSDIKPKDTPKIPSPKKGAKKQSRIAIKIKRGKVYAKIGHKWQKLSLKNLSKLVKNHYVKVSGKGIIKVKVKTIYLYTANGKKTSKQLKNDKIVKIKELKVVKNKLFARVGNKNQWLPVKVLKFK